MSANLLAQSVVGYTGSLTVGLCDAQEGKDSEALHFDTDYIRLMGNDLHFYIRTWVGVGDTLGVRPIRPGAWTRHLCASAETTCRPAHPGMNPRYAGSFMGGPRN